MENKQGEFARQGAKTFGARVRELRIAREWSQGELAARMTAVGYSMHQTTVAKIEGASRPTSIEEAFAIAAILDAPVTDLFSTDRDTKEQHRNASFEAATRYWLLQLRQTQKEEERISAKLRSLLDELQATMQGSDGGVDQEA